MQAVDKLSELYRDYCGVNPDSVTPLPGAGSDRRYFRLSGRRMMQDEVATFSCIGVEGDNLRDCRAFINLADVFSDQGIPVPKVYARSDGHMYYIQQDLGDVSLFDMLRLESAGGGKCSNLESDIMKTITELVKMQSVDPSLWIDLVEYAPFSHRQAMWDLNYFKYEYLRPSAVDFDEDLLEDDFDAFAGDLCEDNGMAYGFMYRDFQSRNVMFHDSKPYFIDFQGGRLGPGIYDVISFLWQAKAGFADDFRNRMLEHYFEERSRLLSEVRDSDKERKLVCRFALFRTLQVLGAYGLRGLVERKAHFIESIPAALSNLKDLIDAGAADSYPELRRVCVEICQDDRFVKEDRGNLLITVFSFSYKKGYPVDFTGNGGGFMFDCRGMHNPGRYAEYRSATGRDKSVVDFLESRGEVQEFVRIAEEMVSPSVETYIHRRFSNLQIGFGCTGGQHRSVYCAERMANILAEKYPSATICLVHREQGIETVFNS